MKKHSNWFWAVATVGVALWGIAGCASTRTETPVIESVGNLTPSYHSVVVAPVHASTDVEVARVIDTGEPEPEHVHSYVETSSGPANMVAKNAHGF